MEVREYSGGAAHVLVIQRFLRVARKGFTGAQRGGGGGGGRLFKADAVNEEDPERDRATQV